MNIHVCRTCKSKPLVFSTSTDKWIARCTMCRKETDHPTRVGVVAMWNSENPIQTKEQ